MKFNRSLDWLKESDEDDNLLADDELDAVEEEINEGLYVDPSNYDKHDDLVDVVDKAGNAQKMTQATYDKNKDSGEFEKKEPEEKEVKVGEKVDARDLKEGNSYVTKEDMYYGDVEEFDGIYDIDELKKKGFVKDNEVVIPAGTKLNYEGFNGGAYTFDINGEEFDLSLDDIDLYSAEEPEKKEPKEKEEPSTKNANNTNIVDLPKEVSTSQLNNILYKDLGIQKKELAKNNKLTEQDLSKVKETLDNGNSIMAHLEFWDDRGYLIELVSIYQKGKDDKIHRSAYQNYSGTWVRDEEDDAEYTYTTDEFTSDVLDSLAEDTKCKLTY